MPGNGLTEITDQAVQNELIGLKDIISKCLPNLEFFSQNSLNEQSALSGIWQSIADWSMPTLIENIIVTFTTAFAEQNALSQTCFETQSGQSQEQFTGLETNLNTSFSSLHEILSTLFNSQIEISTSSIFDLKDNIVEKLQELLGMESDQLPEIDYKIKDVTDQLPEIDYKIKDITDHLPEIDFKIKEVGTKEESHLTSIIEKLKNIADDPLSAIKEGMSNLKEKIEPFLGEAKNTLFGEAGIFGQTKKGVAEEEESNRIGRAANRLAILGLTLEAMSIAATAAASNPFTAVAAVGLGITAAALVAGVGGYADGGYPTMGQMFIAREAGPELVGTIGGRTAVANNDQIVQSVAAGVYDAVAAALSANNGPLVHSLCDAITAALSRSEMVVQVDSREIARASMNGSKRLGYAVAL